jgi:hypothetical protein
MSAAPISESYLLIDELEETLASGSERDCGRMLARVADLFVHGSDHYTDEQIALFDDVLLRLAAEIEMQARARLRSGSPTWTTPRPSSSAPSPSMTPSTWHGRCCRSRHA